MTPEEVKIKKEIENKLREIEKLVMELEERKGTDKLKYAGVNLKFAEFSLTYKFDGNRTIKYNNKNL